MTVIRFVVPVLLRCDGQGVRFARRAARALRLAILRPPGTEKAWLLSAPGYMTRDPVGAAPGEAVLLQGAPSM